MLGFRQFSKFRVDRKHGDAVRTLPSCEEKTTSRVKGEIPWRLSADWLDLYERQAVVVVDSKNSDAVVSSV